MKISNGIIIVLLIFISCDNNVVFNDYIKFNDQTWNSDSSVFFNYSVIDTISKSQVVIKVRHTTDYDFQNLILFVKSKSVDTLDLLLANKEGKWIGSGMGDVRELEFVYMHEEIFAKKEDVIFEIEQAMRYGELTKIQHLKNISAIGLEIKTKNE